MVPTKMKHFSQAPKHKQATNSDKKKMFRIYTRNIKEIDTNYLGSSY